mgnify:CR=1 FL=1
MREKITPEFIRRIPKSDIHLHLDGSLRLSTLIELAKREGVTLPSQTEEGLRKLVFKATYASLAEYLHGFAYTCAVIQNAANLERVACELAEDNIAEGVRYIEVRFAPQLHTSADLSTSEVIRAVNRGLERAAKAHNRTADVKSGEDLPFHYGLIACAMRRLQGSRRDSQGKQPPPRDRSYSSAIQPTPIHRQHAPYRFALVSQRTQII